MDISNRQHEHFENISQKYLTSRNDPKHLYLKEKMWEMALHVTQSNLKQKTDSSFPIRILELMCGNGNFNFQLKKYLSLPYEYHGFDLSESMIKNGKKRDPTLSLSTADILSYKPLEKFDLIVIAGGLHHVFEKASEVVKNISTWLNKGGLFLNLEPINNNLLYKYARYKIYQKNSLFDEKTEKGFTTDELDKMAKNCGLNPIFPLYPGLLTYIFWNNPDALPLLNRGSIKIAKFLLIWKQDFGEKVLVNISLLPDLLSIKSEAWI